MPVLTAERGSYAAIAARGHQSAPARPLTVTQADRLRPAWQAGKPAPAWMADDSRCRLLPAGPLSPIAETSPAHAGDTMDTSRRVVLPAARAFCKQLPAAFFNPRSGLPVTAPPSFSFFHIRPFTEGAPGLGSDGSVRSLFHVIGARHKIPVPPIVPVHEVARGWSLVFCRTADAPALKSIVKLMKSDCFPDLDYDGSDASHLYSDSNEALPASCASLHRVANLALDLSTVDYDNKRQQIRHHVGFRHASLRLPDGQAYQTFSCVLLRFVLHRVASLPHTHDDVAFLLRAVCPRHAVEGLVQTIDAMGAADDEADFVTALDNRQAERSQNSAPNVRTAFPAHGSEIRRTALGEALRKGTATTHKSRAAAERHVRGERALGDTTPPANDRVHEKRPLANNNRVAAKRPVPPAQLPAQPQPASPAPPIVRAGGATPPARGVTVHTPAVAPPAVATAQTVAAGDFHGESEGDSPSGGAVEGVSNAEGHDITNADANAAGADVGGSVGDADDAHVDDDGDAADPTETDNENVADEEEAEGEDEEDEESDRVMAGDAGSGDDGADDQSTGSHTSEQGDDEDKMQADTDKTGSWVSGNEGAVVETEVVTTGQNDLPMLEQSPGAMGDVGGGQQQC